MGDISIKVSYPMFTSILAHVALVTAPKGFARRSSCTQTGAALQKEGPVSFFASATRVDALTFRAILCFFSSWSESS